MVTLREEAIAGAVDIKIVMVRIFCIK